MENRRPPRSNSSGRKPYFDRGRGAPSLRSGKPTGHGGGKNPRRSSRTGEGNYHETGGRPAKDSYRYGERQGDHRRGDNDRFGYGRLDHRKGDGKDRVRPGRTKKSEIPIKITSDAQITDGRLRGKTLVNSTSPHATHTPRKLREIAFKVVSRRLKAARVLDLGAGCGTIGVEAISRGAMLATFVERSARMCSYLRKNLEDLGVKNGHGEVVEMEILPFLKRCSARRRSWDLVYLDLRDSDEHAAILERLSRGVAICSKGLLLIEHAAVNTYPDNIATLRRWRTIDQGEKILSIYERM